MRALIVTLVILLLLFGGAADSAPIIGERYIEVEVVFVTDKYNLYNCRDQKPKDRKGMHVAREIGTNNLMVYCGTFRKKGDIVRIKVEEGI